MALKHISLPYVLQGVKIVLTAEQKESVWALVLDKYHEEG